jgi:hypothetical protein
VRSSEAATNSATRAEQMVKQLVDDLLRPGGGLAQLDSVLNRCVQVLFDVVCVAPQGSARSKLSRLPQELDDSPGDNCREWTVTNILVPILRTAPQKAVLQFFNTVRVAVCDQPIAHMASRASLVQHGARIFDEVKAAPEGPKSGTDSESQMRHAMLLRCCWMLLEQLYAYGQLFALGSRPARCRVTPARAQEGGAGYGEAVRPRAVQSAHRRFRDASQAGMMHPVIVAFSYPRAAQAPKPGPPELRNRLREYKVAAYQCMCMAIMRTQTVESSINAYLFREVSKKVGCRHAGMRAAGASSLCARTGALQEHCGRRGGAQVHQRDQLPPGSFS